MPSPAISERWTLSQYRAHVAQAASVGNAKPAKVRRASPEEDLHRVCMEWVFLHTARYPILKWMVHVPNGGKRPRGEAGKLKAMGTRKGYPDLTLPRRNGVWNGLALELKANNNTATPEQKEWLDAFASDGWLTNVCWTFEEFQRSVQQYLTGEPFAP